MSFQLYTNTTKPVKAARQENNRKPWITSVAVKERQWRGRCPPAQPFWCIYCPKVKVSQLQNHYIFISCVHVHCSGQPSWKSHTTACTHTYIFTHCFGCWLCLGVVFLPLGSAVAQVPNGPERWHLCSPSFGSCNCRGSEEWLQYPSSTARVCQQSNSGTLTDSPLLLISASSPPHPCHRFPLSI